jgi:DNA-binding transcriptional ArsR family regulator
VQPLIQAIRAPRRRAVLRLVWDRELAAGQIHRAMPEVSFGAISQHLKVLRDAGAVEVRREGKHRYYRARREAMGPLATWLEQMWAASLDRLAELAEADDREGKQT